MVIEDFLAYQKNVSGIPLSSSTKTHVHSCLKPRPVVLSAYGGVIVFALKQRMVV